MMAQMSLLPIAATSQHGTHAERFERFHLANPHIYDDLVMPTRRAAHRGRKRVGIAQLYEVLRWQYVLEADNDGDFKLNNNYRSFYSRKIMECECDLRGVFETRELRAA